MHNILKGQRGLTSRVADLLLEQLHVCVLDLAEPGELGGALERRRGDSRGVHHVGICAGLLGAAHPFPDLGSPVEWVKVPWETVLSVARPVLVELGGEECARMGIPSGGLGLVDISEGARIRIEADALYVLRWSGAGYIRQIRKDSRRLVVVGQERLWDQVEPVEIPLDDVGVLQVVRGRLARTGPDPRRPQFVDVRPAASV
jgi:hypothetical protein